MKIIETIRYRFFLFAGLFPFFLGQALAFSAKKSVNGRYFWLGFLGILLLLAGVELFNEYFDAREGGDRIFSQKPQHIPYCFFPLGVLAFLLAFLIGLYLSFQIGRLILLFSFLGFLGAYFYVGPPIKWAYRGLGEIVIALCYGPFMLLGSYYLQAKKIDFLPFFVSLLCGLFLFCLALLNEIPDYYQDRLVGKKNLVVRLGKKGAVKLFFLGLICFYSLFGVGVACNLLPLLAAVSFLLIPWFIKSLKVAENDYDNPKAFLSAININIIAYLVIALTLGLGYLIS